MLGTTNWSTLTSPPRPFLGRTISAAYGGTTDFAASTSGVEPTSAQTVVPASGLSGPTGVAVDSWGDVFIADQRNVLEVPKSGPQTIVGSGLSGPDGVAVDSSGDVFISELGNVVEVPKSGPQTTVGSGIHDDTGVAVDSSGDVFIADSFNGRVVEVPKSGPQTTVGSGLSFPEGVAVDSSGDVFIADSGNNQVVEVPKSGPQTTVGSGFNFPRGVAVDSSGDVFIADNLNNRVVEVTPSGTQTTVGSGLNRPEGVAVDSSGDVFIADSFNFRVVEVNAGVPVTVSPATPTITWPTPTAITYGTPLSSTQLDATAGWTVGGSAVTVTGTFTYAPAAGTILKAGPQTLSEHFVPDDTTDYTTPADQTVTLTVNSATPTITWPTPTAITYGTPLSSAQLDATASWTVAGSPVTVAGTFTYTPPANTVLGAGSQTLSAHFAPQDTTDYAPADLSVPLTVQAVSPTFFRLSASQTIVYGTATINVSGTLAAFTAVPANQTVTITVGGASATATVGADGTFKTTITTSAIQAATTPYTIFYSYTDSSDSNFLPASDSSTTLTVNKATPTISWPTPAAIAYGTALSSTQLDATAGWTVGGSPVTVAGTFTYNPPANTVLAAGPNTLSAHFAPQDATDYNTPADQSITLLVNKDATTTVVAAPTAADYGQAVTITATVTSNVAGAGTPTGTVTLVDSTTGVTLGSPSVGSNGMASVTVSNLPPGAQTIVASYGGDGNFVGSSTATGSTVTVIGSVIVLDPKASGALQVTGGSRVTTPGLVEVDSSSSSAVIANGSGQVKAGSIQVVGGVNVSGGASLSPKPVTGATALVDPLAGLAVPTAGTSFGAVNLGGSSAETIPPGVYSAIKVSGNARLTMQPGIYEIAGGGFSVGNSAQVTGTGVMIYNAGSKYPSGTGGSYGAISFSGSAVVQLSAPTTGTYAGIVIFQSRDNTQTLSFNTSGVPDLNGLIYAPAAPVSVSGAVQLEQTSLIADELQISGSATMVPFPVSGGSDVLASSSIVVPTDGAPQGPLGLAAVASPRSGPASVARAMDPRGRAASTTAPVSLAASSRPVAMGLASGGEGEDAFSLGDSEVLDEVAVGLIGSQVNRIEDSTPARSKART